MKRHLLCSMALVGLLAGAGLARVQNEAMTLESGKRDPGVMPSARTASCDQATTIDCDYSGIGSFGAGEGLWFYYVGTGTGLSLATCFDETTADSDLYIIDNCTDQNVLFYRDGDSNCGYKTFLNCQDFLFEDGVGYYILLTDYYGDAADVRYEFTCCEAPEEFVCPDLREHIEGGAGEFCGDYMNSLDCGDAVCGEISDGQDYDYFWMTVPDLGGPSGAGAIVTINVYGDDTFGQAPFGFGLDPWVKVYDEMCTTLIAADDDSGEGFDSRLVIDCLEPGIYMVEIFTGWNAPGPYIVTMSCTPCCDEDNDITNPDVLITEDDFMNYIGEDNAFVTSVSLCDYCNLTQIGPGTFGNGHTIQRLDGGEYWFNIYQPGADPDDCYAMLMRTTPAYYPPENPTCTPLMGVGQNGALLGWFALDPSEGLYPSVYNNDGTTQSTFVIDAPASCCDEVTVAIWYEDLCIPTDAVELPAGFSLGQNYPNPFNPTTTIDFSVAEAGTVTLTVSNLTGQTVATLVNGMVERGAHSVVFDASQLTTGVYFYTLEAAGHSVSKKMVLVK
jgi:hypothetical protein